MRGELREVTGDGIALAKAMARLLTAALLCCLALACVFLEPAGAGTAARADRQRRRQG